MENSETLKQVDIVGKKVYAGLMEGLMEKQNSLKFMREYKGITQASLAEKSGVPLRTIQAYEQGYKDIHKGNVVSVLRLAEALECDVYEIL